MHQWQGVGEEGIHRVFQENGAIQLDPLNPAGRNHDLFFLARIPDYKIGQFESLCYHEKCVFENYFSFLCAISREFFPYFHYKHDILYLDKYTRPAIEKFNENLPGVLDAILEYVQEHGPTQGQDLAHLGKANPEFASWKSSRVSGTALEYLWRLGKLAIVQRDKNFRKVYGVMDEYFLPSELVKKDYNEAELILHKFFIRFKSFPVLIARVSKKDVVESRNKWLITFQFPLEELLQNQEKSERNLPTIVKTEEMSKYYLVPSNWMKLVEEPVDDEIRAIAPLDPIIYERKQLKEVFSFDYNWEVYKKKENRIWGYYVYPLLYQGKFIGRLEAKYEKKLKKLRIFNLQFEADYKINDQAKEAFSRLLERWKEMVNAETIALERSL